MYPRKNKPSSSYEVYLKDEKQQAVRCSPFFNWKMGAFYATFYWVMLMVLPRRYGKPWWLGLCLLPFLGAIAITLLFDADPLVFMLIQEVLRGVLGVFVANKDSTLYQEKLILEGWVSVGVFEAKSKKEAIAKANEFCDFSDAPIHHSPSIKERVYQWFCEAIAGIKTIFGSWLCKLSR